MADSPRTYLVDTLWSVGDHACLDPACPARGWSGDGEPPAKACGGWLTSTRVAALWNQPGEDWSTVPARLSGAVSAGAWVKRPTGARPKSGFPEWLYHVGSTSHAEIRARSTAQVAEKNRERERAKRGGRLTPLEVAMEEIERLRLARRALKRAVLRVKIEALSNEGNWYYYSGTAADVEEMRTKEARVKALLEMSYER